MTQGYTPVLFQRGDIVETVITGKNLWPKGKRFVVDSITTNNKVWGHDKATITLFDVSQLKLISRPDADGWHKHDSHENPVRGLRVKTAEGFPPVVSEVFVWSAVKRFAVVDDKGEIIKPEPTAATLLGERGPEAIVPLSRSTTVMTPPTQYFDGSTLKTGDRVTVELTVQELSNANSRVHVSSTRGNSMTVSIDEIRTHNGKPVQHKPREPKVRDMVMDAGTHTRGRLAHIEGDEAVIAAEVNGQVRLSIHPLSRLTVIDEA